MVESYKYKSKAATAVSFIAMYILYIGQDGLNQALPKELLFIVPFLVYLAGYIVTQTTENTRVNVAEQIKENEVLNEIKDNIGSDEEDSFDSFEDAADIEEDSIEEEEPSVDEDGV